MDATVLLLLLFNLCSFSSADSDGQYLLAFKAAVHDPENALQSWDANLADPCTWLHITCDQYNNVIRIDLQNTKLSGFLIPELGRLSSLQYIELFNNNFSGSIPKELGQLKHLIALDLYANKLTGDIPRELDGLSSLVFLRLNDNKLSGNIPSSLTKISTLSVLELSNNQLSGAIPTNGSFVKFIASSFQGNPSLCGDVIHKPCG